MTILDIEQIFEIELDNEAYCQLKFHTGDPRPVQWLLKFDCCGAQHPFCNECKEKWMESVNPNLVPVCSLCAKILITWQWIPI